MSWRGIWRVDALFDASLFFFAFVPRAFHRRYTISLSFYFTRGHNIAHDYLIFRDGLTRLFIFPLLNSPDASFALPFNGINASWYSFVWPLFEVSFTRILST
jgi:hypothetical protein